MNEDLAVALGTQESACLEFKQSGKDTKAIRAAICAFANDLARVGGGDLLIGVDKAGNAVDDVDTSDRTLLAYTDMRDDGKIVDRPSLTVQKAMYQGKDVVWIRVQASTSPPVRLDGAILVRPGPTTRRAGREDERVLIEKRKSLEGPYDIRAFETATTSDLDLQLFSSTVLPALVSPEALEDDGRTVEEQLSSLRLCSSEGFPTTMGILLVGLDPTTYIPGAYVQFVRYAGSDLDAPISDSQELRNNAINAAAVLGHLLRGHLHTAVTGGASFDEESHPQYPLIALREACMNAIIHRNYETSNAPVRIAWFDDRIEINNPGGPYGQVSPHNFDRVNDYRNPSLAGAMKSLGYVNRFGRGIGRIRTSLEKNSNPPAEFAVDEYSWTVVIRSAT